MQFRMMSEEFSDGVIDILQVEGIQPSAIGRIGD